MTDFGVQPQAGLTSPEVLSSGQEARAIVRSLPGAYVLVAADAPRWTILAASDAYLAATLTQLDGPAGIVGRPVFDVFPENPAHAVTEQSEQSVRRAFERVAESGEPYTMPPLRYDIPLPKEMGGGYEERYWEMVNTPVKDADGCITSVLHHVSDITAHRHVETERARLLEYAAIARRESDEVQDRLQLVLTAAQLGVWELDLTSGTMICSDQCRANFGLEPGAPFDYRDLLAAIHPDDLPRMQASVRDALDNHSNYSAEYRAMWPDGTQHWIAADGRATYDEDGVPVQMAGVTHEVSVRRRAESERDRALIDAQSATIVAEEANRVKVEFLANMSHELRTPLNAIGGHVQLIEMGIYGPVTEKQQDALARVTRAQQHLLGLINDVLNYARLERGRVEYDLEPVVLPDVVAHVGPMIEPQLAAKGLTYEVRTCANDCVVWADRDKLVQVLLNLLSNAVKFTPSGGSVVVDVTDRTDGTQPKDVIYLRVSDTGVGIPYNKLESAFEPFVQVNAGNSSRGEGTGLGLTISRDLARGMGGDIRARSTVGAGTAFTLTLRRVIEDGGQKSDTPG